MARNKRADKFVYEEGDLVFEDDPDLEKAVDEEDAALMMGPVHPLGRITDDEDLPLIVESEFTTEQQEMYKSAFNDALTAMELRGLEAMQSVLHASNIAWKFVTGNPASVYEDWMRENWDAFHGLDTETADANVVPKVMAKDADDETHADPGRAGRIAGEESRS